MLTQECPTCGRPLRIQREHLGQVLTCGHCRGLLLADVPSEHVVVEPRTGGWLLRRAEKLLAQVAGLRDGDLLSP